MNKLKKLIAALVLVLLVIVGWTYRGGTAGSTIVLGASLPLTGNSASFGERAKYGIDLAIADANTTHKNKISVVYEDDKGEAAAAVTVANKLINQDHVVAIIGPLKSDPVLAIAPIVEVNKIIEFSPTAGAATISDAGDYVFRNIEKPEVHGETATNYVIKNGMKRAALFTAQASNAQGYGKLFREFYEKAGGGISLAVEYNADEKDFRSSITKAMQSKAEVLYLAVATAKDGGIITKQARELGFKGMIIASVAIEAREFIDTAGIAAEGVLVTSPAYDASAHSDYVTKFENKFKRESDWVSANSYDAVLLLADAIDACGEKGNPKDTGCIKDYLYSVKGYDGVGGLTTFDQKGDVSKPVLIKKVVNGSFEIIK